MENPKNLIIVIFGASGDLTFRMLMPAICSLRTQKLMPEKYAILGVGRTKISTEDFRIKMCESIVTCSEEKVSDQKIISAFAQDLYYHSMDNSSESSYSELKSLLRELYFLYGYASEYV
jgi:glucose-6-phosphate 1-dehydrogenase